MGERPAIPEALRHALEKARSLGFLGPAPVDAQVRHSEGLAAVAARYFERFGRGAPDVVLELGSGGGVPGLVLAAAWPDAEFILLDSNHRRTAFLVETVHALGWDERARVICERAEVAGHDAALRGSADFVVSRSFGSPAATAECGAPFLSVGGLLVVTEPPPPVDSETRWPLSGSATPTSSTPAISESTRAWLLPMTPTPTTPIRNLPVPTTLRPSPLRPQALSTPVPPLARPGAAGDRACAGTGNTF